MKNKIVLCNSINFVDLTVKSEDNVIDLLSPEPKPEAMSMETDAEKTCRGIVEQIRREEFGIGVELNEDGQRLMRVQQERLGRSLDRLSKDLYSKDTHFVLGEWSVTLQQGHILLCRFFMVSW